MSIILRYSMNWISYHFEGNEYRFLSISVLLCSVS